MIKIELPEFKEISYNSFTCYTGKPVINNEPDHVKFTINSTGSKCVINRNMSFGTLCGYILLTKNLSDEIINNLDVHGGITFDEIVSELKEHSLVNDFKALKEERIIGFDCGHSNDLYPIIKYKSCGGSKYRDVSYVINELLKLDKQIKEQENT